MQENLVKSRSNQTNLMGILKKCIDETSHEQSAESPATSVSSKASRYQVDKPSSMSFNLDKDEDQLRPQMSMLIPNRRNNYKPASKAKQLSLTKSDTIKDTNIDNVGEAAEWLQKGTKQEEEFNDNEIAPLGSSISNVRERMQDKADKIMTGSYRQPRVPTSQDLMQKAKMLRQDNQRRVRPQNQPTSYVQVQPEVPNNRIIEEQQQPNVINQIGQNEDVRLVQPQDVINRLLVEEDEDTRWDHINQQTLNQKKQAILTKKQYTKEEIQQYFLNRDVSTQKKVIEMQLAEYVQESSYFEVFMACFGKAKKSSQSQIRLQLISLSKIQITSDQDAYLLEATWKMLTDRPFNRYGQHWADIGFQGRDPATDLRSTGVLSLLLIYFLGKTYPNYFKEVYNSSTNGIFEYPFAISLVKIAGTYLQLLKKDKLPATDFKQYCDWFAAICYSVYERLQKEKLMITEFGIVITKLLDETEDKLKDMLKVYKAASLN